MGFGKALNRILLPILVLLIVLIQYQNCGLKKQMNQSNPNPVRGGDLNTSRPSLAYSANPATLVVDKTECLITNDPTCDIRVTWSSSMNASLWFRNPSGNLVWMSNKGSGSQILKIIEGTYSIEVHKGNDAKGEVISDVVTVTGKKADAKAELGANPLECVLAPNANQCKSYVQWNSKNSSLWIYKTDGSEYLHNNNGSGNITIDVLLAGLVVELHNENSPSRENPRAKLELKARAAQLVNISCPISMKLTSGGSESQNTTLNFRPYNGEDFYTFTARANSDCSVHAMGIYYQLCTPEKVNAGAKFRSTWELIANFDDGSKSILDKRYYNDHDYTCR